MLDLRYHIDQFWPLAGDMADMRAFQNCVYFLRGTCKNDTSCPYKHDVVSPTSLSVVCCCQKSSTVCVLHLIRLYRGEQGSCGEF